VLRPTSRRHATLEMNLNPATGYSEIVAGPDLDCSASTSITISCVTDKLDDTNPRYVTVKAPAPASGNLVNTAVFGWKGNTATVTTTMGTAPPPAGYTYFPPGPAMLKTKATKSVSAQDPVYSEVAFTSPAGGVMASLKIVTKNSVPKPPALPCTGGLFYTAGGQALLCHDADNILADLTNNTLIPGGDSSRYLYLDVMTDQPIEFSALVLDHSSIYPGNVQVALSALFPPPIFYAGKNADGTFTAVRGTGVTCASNGNVAPCMNGLQQTPEGNFEFTAKLSLDVPFIVAKTPTDHLFALMDLVLHPVVAGTIKPPVLYK
jgi:hypothetical protein